MGLNLKGRTLYRYVDWNFNPDEASDTGRVVPYIGTWIETEFEDKIAEAGQGRTLYRYVDWNLVR